jgi:hypothetical protein
MASGADQAFDLRDLQSADESLATYIAQVFELRDFGYRGTSERQKSEVGMPHPSTKSVMVSFDLPGPLGIEFKALAAPWVVTELHSEHARDCLRRGDLLVQAAGIDVQGLPWDELLQLLVERPVTMLFQRTTETKDNMSNAAASDGSDDSFGVPGEQSDKHDMEYWS